MSFADELAELGPRPGPRCITCDWYRSQDGDTQQAFNQYVAQGRTVTGLHRAASKYGLRCTIGALTYHLRNHHSDILIEQAASP